MRGALIARKLNRKRLNQQPVDEGDDADNDNNSSEDKSKASSSKYQEVYGYLQVCRGEKNKITDDKEINYKRRLRESFRPFIYSIVFLGCLWGIIILSPIANGARWRMGLLASLVLVVPGFLWPALDTWVSTLRRPHNNPKLAGYRSGYFQLPISSLLAPTGFFVLFPYEREYEIWCYVQIFLRILTTTEMLVPVVFFYFACHGVFRFYMASLLLLDCIFLSDRLQTVINAVVKPIKDIVATFILMGFMVYIFTAFGMYQFGGMIVYYDDSLEIDGNAVVIPETTGWTQCPNLAVCFLEFFDVGLRSGDIVDASFDDLTYRDGIYPWFGRIVYGLAFFLVIGVILFDIVTGIIIDTFGSMREELAKRHERKTRCTFIAGVERATIEGSQLNFSDVNDVDQDKWNYVYLMVHLKNKNPDDFTGAESYIKNCIDNGDVTWLPQNTCWALQVKDIDIEKDDPAANREAMKKEIIDKTSRQISEASETLQKEIEKIVREALNPISKNITALKLDMDELKNKRGLFG